MINKKKLEEWLLEKKGVLVTSSARVFRESYFGNSILAPNSSTKDADHRGFVPVELWIMSGVQADNPIVIPGEGITKVPINEELIALTELRSVAETQLFGEYGSRWPLTKILDIGGESVKTSFGTTETPPIPVHVHGGSIVDGKVTKPGKTEAYFFPPTNIPPYNKTISAKTRIGLKPGVTKNDIKEKLKHFGKDDATYMLLNEYEIKPMTGWTVPQGVLHAPGPYLTFEIQLPQDDYNLASWRLGERLEANERKSKYQHEVLRGLKDEDELIDGVLDWPLTTDQNLEKKYFHETKPIASGSWGKRYQIFFDMFYGEGWEILPGQTLTLAAKDVPQAGVVWSGYGEINGNSVSHNAQNEFLLIPQTQLTVTNSSKEILYIYTVEPIQN